MPVIYRPNPRDYAFNYVVRFQDDPEQRFDNYLKARDYVQANWPDASLTEWLDADYRDCDRHSVMRRFDTPVQLAFSPADRREYDQLLQLIQDCNDPGVSQADYERAKAMQIAAELKIDVVTVRRTIRRNSERFQTRREPNDRGRTTEVYRAVD